MRIDSHDATENFNGSGRVAASRTVTNTPRRVRLPTLPVAYTGRAYKSCHRYPHTVLSTAPTYFPAFKRRPSLFVRLGPRPLMFTRTGHRSVFTTIRRTRCFTRDTRRCNEAMSRRARGVIKSEVTRVNYHPRLKINGDQFNGSRVIFAALFGACF